MENIKVMIKEITMYTVICDNCGIDSNEGQEYSCWGESSHAVDCALDSDWHEHEGKHYCDYCFSWGDEDEVIISEDRKGKFVK